MRFEFATAAKIIFGPGTVSQLPSIASSFGTRVLLATGRNPARLSHIREALEQAGLACILFTVPGEPSVNLVREGVRVCLASDRELVIGIGGGSVIDAAKAIAILSENSGEPLDYLEVAGVGKTLEHPGLPFIAVPTTAGTGAEVTRNAVLDSPEHGLKASLRSPMMLAKVALVDPELTLSLPRSVTVHSGLDAFTQLLEAYVCRNANPFTDSLCEQGLTRVRDALPRCISSHEDAAARESMSYASLLSGLALANAGLGVVHGLASPAGGMTGAAHGALCAAFLAAGVRANITALRSREPANPALAKYERAAQLLAQSDLPESIASFAGSMDVPRLRPLGLRREQIPELVEKAARANSMKTNPIALTSEELTEVVERSF